MLAPRVRPPRSRWRQKSSRGIPRTTLEEGKPGRKQGYRNSLRAVGKRQDSVGTVLYLVCVIRNGDCQTVDDRDSRCKDPSTNCPVCDEIGNGFRPRMTEIWSFGANQERASEKVLLTPAFHGTNVKVPLRARLSLLSEVVMSTNIISSTAANALQQRWERLRSHKRIISRIKLLVEWDQEG